MHMLDRSKLNCTKLQILLDSNKSSWVELCVLENDTVLLHSPVFLSQLLTWVVEIMIERSLLSCFLVVSFAIWIPKRLYVY